MILPHRDGNSFEGFEVKTLMRVRSEHVKKWGALMDDAPNIGTQPGTHQSEGGSANGLEPPTTESTGSITSFLSEKRRHQIVLLTLCSHGGDRHAAPCNDGDRRCRARAWRVRAYCLRLDALKASASYVSPALAA